MADREQLSVIDHRRDRAARRYVYPVVSRRAGGVSVGVNLSPNHACNWRCRYCQVPELVRGAGPAIDLELLAGELGSMLDDGGFAGGDLGREPGELPFSRLEGLCHLCPPTTISQ